MKVNRIYRYYGISKGSLYEHLKTTFTEAFTGFNGISFETILAAASASGYEEYKIYLNPEKSMWLRIYWDGVVSSSTTVSTGTFVEMNFKDGSTYNVANVSSGSPYRYYNIVRTRYGVMFTNIYSASDAGEMAVSNTDFANFFAVGAPNIFVHTKSSSNTVAGTYTDYWWSDLHTAVEQMAQYSALIPSSVGQTALFTACSAIQPITCDHLYRLAYYGGTSGKIKLGDKYLILGCRYALEYDPDDGGVEYVSPQNS